MTGKFVKGAWVEDTPNIRIKDNPDNIITFKILIDSASAHDELTRVARELADIQTAYQWLQHIRECERMTRRKPKPKITFWDRVKMLFEKR